MPRNMPEERREISRLAMSAYLFVFLGVVGLPPYILYKEDKNIENS